MRPAKQKNRKKEKKGVKEVFNKDPQEESSGVVADVSSWAQYHLGSGVLDALARLGFSAPTHVQAECLPAAIRDRRDVIGAAQTVRLVIVQACFIIFYT